MSEIAPLLKKIQKLQSDNSSLRSQTRSILMNTGMTFEKSVEELKSFLSEEKKKVFNVNFPKLAVHRPLKKSVFDSDHSETVCLMLSDLHVAEVVQPLEVNGMNKHNTMILANKINTWKEKVLKIIRGHQSMYKIDKIWIPVLGDMISGSIHHELVLTNELLDYPSSVLAARLVIMAVESIKTLGIPIEIDMVVGNHARALPKLTTKKQAHLSLDWMTYVMVEEYFAKDELVTTRVHQSQIALVEMRGHRFALEHGAGFPFAKMSSLEDRLRKVFDNRTYREASGMTGTSIDFVLVGDKHRASWGDSHAVNGCFPGASEITTSWRLSPIRAQQIMFGISDSRPMTFAYLIDITDVQSEETDNPFSRYTRQFLDIHGR